MEYPRHDVTEKRWERVTDKLDRVEVLGGWLYRTTTYNGEGVAMQFVPNPDYWATNLIQEEAAVAPWVEIQDPGPQAE